MNLPSLALAAGLAGWTPVTVTAPPPGAARPPVLPPVAAAPAGNPVSWDAFITGLMSARVIAVGEKHDEPSHHLAQARVVAALGDRDPSLVVGFEMVSQDQQAELDGLAAGTISEADFAAWWDKTWGFDYKMYKPIFDAARARHLRMVGLNAPLPIVIAVAKKGLAGLSPAERAQLPASIQESADARYRDFVKSSLEGHKMPPDALARMIQAQAVWNETMGANAAKAAATGARIVVIAGQGHVFWKAGVLESAARRGAGPTAAVLAYPLDGEHLSPADALNKLRDPKSGDLALADDFLIVP